jgi:hypothetical protein
MLEWSLYNIDHFLHPTCRSISAMNFFGGNAEGPSRFRLCRGSQHFNFDAKTLSYHFTPEGKPATAFLPNLILQLQFSGTVKIDLRPTSLARQVTHPATT